MSELQPIQNVVELRGVTIAQGKRPILQDVDLAIASGEFVYLIGRSGTGKSSLLKTLYGDLPLAGGEGRVAEFNLRQLDERNIPLLRRRLGIVFQDFNLLNDRTVYQNLEFVLRATGTPKENISRRIIDVMELVSLENKQHVMPHELSGGEQQRVVIARALLNQPDIIIADEPTGNLDPETSDDIIMLLRYLCREAHTAVLIATHDYLSIEKFPARIIRCANGRLSEGEMQEIR